MFSLFNANGLRTVLEQELIPFSVSLVIAQVFFKWGSFGLELLGFLALWFVLGLIVVPLLRKLKR